MNPHIPFYVWIMIWEGGRNLRPTCKVHRLTPHDTKCLQEFKQYIKGNLYLHVNIGQIIKLFIVQNLKVSFIFFFYFLSFLLLLFISYNDAKCDIASNSRVISDTGLERKWRGGRVLFFRIRSTSSDTLAAID